MHILLVTHYYDSHGGGIEIVARYLAEKLLDRYGDIKMTWIASDVDPPPSGVERLISKPIKTSNSLEKKIGIPYPLWGWHGVKTLNSSMKQVDIVHIHDYLYFGNILTFILAKFHRKPVVITQHIGNIPYKNFFLRNLLKILNRTLGRFILGRSDRAVFISDAVRSYFFGTKKNDHAALVPNGVDLEIFYSLDDVRRKNIKINGKDIHGKPVFLFVGRFVEKKGLHILSKLAGIFDSVHWIFVGWGPIDPADWGFPNVQVLFRPDKSDIVRCYQSADILILPSKGEGYPLVVQESMACGTPVAVSEEVKQAYKPASPLMYSFCSENESGLEQWSDGIYNILQDLDRLKSIRGEVSDFAKNHWSWDICSGEYRKIFFGILGVR